jgi:hypothetical protein
LVAIPDRRPGQVATGGLARRIDARMLHQMQRCKLRLVATRGSS